MSKSKQKSKIEKPKSYTVTRICMVCGKGYTVETTDPNLENTKCFECFMDNKNV